MARNHIDIGAKARIAERRNQAFRFKKAGLSYRDIALRLEVSVWTAHNDVTRVIESLNSETRHEAEEWKFLMTERLEDYHVSIYAKGMKGELGAIEKLLSINESFRRLHGLDAAKKVAPTTPDGEQELGAETADERALLKVLTDEELKQVEIARQILDKAKERRVRPDLS